MSVVLAGVAARGDEVSGTRAERFMGELHAGLAERGTFVSVHAGEYLVALGEGNRAAEAFRPQAAEAKGPYRIGVWRVLAMAEATEAGRAGYVEKIRGVLMDERAAERVHAMEALAKVGAPIRAGKEDAVVRAIAAKEDAAAPFALWRLVLVGDEAAVGRLVGLLGADDVITRFRAAYVLGRLGRGRDEVAAALAKEPRESMARTAMIVSAGGDGVVELAKGGDVGARRLAAAGLAALGELNARQRDAVETLLRDEDADVRMSAAYGLLNAGAKGRPR